MRLRNLFMILLLCMTVGVFSACTGDDGAQGPPGPPGPPGPAGDAGEAGAGAEDTDFYNFLTSWGSETGEIGCSDEALTGSGPLPGGDGALNHKLADPAPAPQVNNNPVAVTCGDDFFSSISVTDVNTLGDLNLTDVEDDANDAFTPGNSLVFVPSAKGSDKSVVDVPSTEFNPASRVTTTKTFIGGSVFADMNMGSDVDEPGERQDLYSQCGVGTAPSYLVGMYRAVQIVDSVQPYKDGLPVDQSPSAQGATDDDDIDPLPPITTVKLCVVLDSLPGVTKCLVTVVNDPDPTKNGRRVAIYDGAEFHTVVPADELYDGATLDGTTVGTDNADQSKDVFQPADDVATNDDSTNLENICSLFSEGGSDS